jgi:nitroreductase
MDADGRPSLPAPTLADVAAGLEMPLRQAMETQRSVRRLRPDPVDDAIVLRCIELALKAPSGSNAQNWEFIVVRDAEVKRRLARQYARAWRLFLRVERWLPRSTVDDGEHRLRRAVAWQVAHFAETPVIVVACLRGVRLPAMTAVPIAASSYYGSIYPSVQNLLLAARAVGLGATLVTLPLWSTIAARAILGLPRSVTPCCVVPLGWPRGRYGPTSRKPVEAVVHLDRYGHQPWRA